MGDNRSAGIRDGPGKHHEDSGPCVAADHAPFLDAGDEDDFDRTIKEFKEKAIYDTGITPRYGDKFITLVTCSYQEEGRFVVIARKQD